MTLTKKYENAINNKEVFKGIVHMIYFDEDLQSDVLLLDHSEARFIIKREQIDSEMEWKSLINFVGREVQYIILSVDEETKTVFASRKEAQLITRETIIPRLQEGEVMPAKVVNILRYAAFVEIQGVTGLLKNKDFAEDHTAIGDVLTIGDTVNVKLKKLSSRLIFESVEKYKNPTIFDFDLYKRNQVVFGTVVTVQPWGVFVRLAGNIDALCSLPGTGELEEGSRVRFRITKVFNDGEQNRIRGKIVDIIG
ncbi:hypothetical protein ABD91_25715 [Lysinibacillus sphaericus]|uniref:S1 RNA-binding domain-containing protein n=1 Tax=Lysinibacillus sphaericus TaxID=1421 RepID=UPI0018CCC02C|nr:S1 RNA-binding domain-containing protein [Lysinibacillus sphaericus]MBG9694140.1 hypothetical protein [Lysinibacillus sphaericus]